MISECTHAMSLIELEDFQQNLMTTLHEFSNHGYPPTVGVSLSGHLAVSTATGAIATAVAAIERDLFKRRIRGEEKAC